MSSAIVLPRVMQVGAGASSEVASILSKFNCEKPLIVTDQMMKQLGYVERIELPLKEQGINCGLFADCLPEPTDESIMAGVAMIEEGDYDSIIALGGGSPIDSAKAISILGKFGGAMRDYRVPRDVSETGLPIIAIPTTAGTGSEATRFTIITDANSDEKMLCAGLGFMPVAALVDYELTLSLPARVTADTGIDALTHAMEAYVSRKANAYSDSQALQAMALIAPNLRRVYHEPDNRKAREAMMLGATLAGVAFSNASVALVHGMSRPIGAHFHVPHGLSNAMLLPAITEYSIEAASERYADCARAMTVAEPADSDAVANEKLLTELKAINKELEVPGFAEYGIEKERFFSLLELMAEQALASGSPNNNPRQPSKEEMVSLYTKIWEQQ
ncbi:alcohol dehydrogenase [Endozoicomonas sp. OPT23]|uniref:iron-containing alcohol dehydrogenase n=1 Tax=Endozoicomonas sp. OPT23 TaxID=2072845 RepID=UPI00129B0146|nr:iron-containing alcohol dehydrogenase [Endozoicomonas sp. OPT23]MRI35152.1 alcohol dehydrogenase [Endozoicomonas sp. OPT23]